jgi:Ca2+/Na+ antiporter
LLLLYIVAFIAAIATYNYYLSEPSSIPFSLFIVIFKSGIFFFLSIYEIGTVIILYFCSAFLIWALKMRKRIIIESFEEDDEKDCKQKDLNGPLHDLLAYELCRIFKLYSDVDKSNPVSRVVPVVPTTNVSIRVENVSDLISSVVTEDSVITIGPLKIPAKILLSLFGRFFEAKKIRGSLSYSNQEIILIATYAGGDRCHCWKVHRPYPPPISSNLASDDKKASSLDENSARGLLIREMIEELAYRIFTDLTEFHSFRWESTKEFMIGL